MSIGNLTLLGSELLILVGECVLKDNPPIIIYDLKPMSSIRQIALEA